MRVCVCVCLQLWVCVLYVPLYFYLTTESSWICRRTINWSSSSVPKGNSKEFVENQPDLHMYSTPAFNFCTTLLLARNFCFLRFVAMKTNSITPCKKKRTGRNSFSILSHQAAVTLLNATFWPGCPSHSQLNSLPVCQETACTSAVLMATKKLGTITTNNLALPMTFYNAPSCCRIFLS